MTGSCRHHDEAKRARGARSRFIRLLILSVVVAAGLMLLISSSVMAGAPPIYGTVAEPGGAPIADHEVVLFREGQQIATTLTDANGFYSFDYYGGPNEILVNGYPGYQNAWFTNIDASQTSVQLNVFLQRGYDFDGTIEDCYGNPVSGVLIDAVGRDSSAAYHTVTGANGVFCFQGLIPDIYDFAATSGAAEVTWWADVRYYGYTQFLAWLPAPGGDVIAGEVGEPYGPALVGHPMALFRDGELVATTLTDSSGHYTFSTAGPGDYTVFMSGYPGYADGFLGAPFVASGKVDCDFYVPPGHELSGTIVDTNGVPVYGAHVWAYGVNSSVENTYTAPDGTFRFHGLTAQGYHLRVTTPYPGVDLWFPGPVPFDTTDPLGLNAPITDLSAGSVSGLSFVVPGTVASSNPPIYGTVAEPGGAPIADHEVVLFREGQQIATTLTDANGFYSFDYYGGPNEILVNGYPGYQNAWFTNIDASQTSVQLNVFLQRGYDFDGTIEDCYGNPVSGVLIDAVGRDSSAAYHTVTGANGVFCFQGLIPDIYDFAATSGAAEVTWWADVRYYGYTQFLAWLPAPGGDVIAGEVGEPYGPALVGHPMALFRDGELVATTLTDSSGHYTFSTAGPGDYTVFMSGYPGYADGFLGAPFVASGKVDCDFYVPPGHELSGTIVDTNGVPVYGAHVWAYGVNSSVENTYTAPDGTFRFHGLTAQGYHLRVTTPYPGVDLWFPGPVPFDTTDPLGLNAPITDLSAGSVSGLSFVVPGTADGTPSGLFRIEFDKLTSGGVTSFTEGSGAPPSEFPSIIGYFEVSTTCTYQGAITLAFPYDAAAYPDPSLVRVFHFENGRWTDATLKVEDGLVFAQVTSLSPFVVVVDNVPPTLSGVPADITVEATGPDGATVSWTAPTATDLVDPAPVVSCAPPSGSLFPLGTTTVNVTATDVSGNTASDSFTVTVVVPVVNLPALDPISEGSSLQASGSFTCPVTDTWAATVDYGDGSGSQPLELSADKTFVLSHLYRDNRPAEAPYTVTVVVSGEHGGVGTASTQLTVRNVAPVIGNMYLPTGSKRTGIAITASAPFSDPGIGDVHTALWSWGDGTTSAGTVTEAEGSGTVTGAHSYVGPGLYTVELRVTDQDGGTATASYRYVVVYDPKAGYLASAGWFNSPVGAIPGSALTGKTLFTFNCGYVGASTTPAGVAAFTFPGKNLGLALLRFDWLVVSGPVAYSQGACKINGKSGYTYFVAVQDGLFNPEDGHDRIRVRVWKTTSGEMIYDTQPGAPLDAAPTLLLGGGFISIRK